ncbi:MAG: hypothetical protein HY744_20260 [Deltaproteobacteria bacterium]|nr:hypothetical protein [Deltaproteobacteria bacterium]
MSAEQILEHKEQKLLRLAAAELAMVRRRAKELARIGRALGQIATVAGLDDGRKVRQARAVLAQSSAEPAPAPLAWGPVLAALDEEQEERLAQLRVAFGRQLTEAACAAGLACERVSAAPLEFALPPLTATVDLERARATLCYARLPLGEVPARPERILAAQQKHVKALQSGWAPETFFDALREAYAAVLKKEGRPEGERVVLVDLLAPLAFAAQSRKFWADPVAENFRPYGRARLAWDLACLRRSGLLQRVGWRLSLGVATGESTRRKQDVLYVEECAGHGQYYLSAWFAPAPEAHT